MQLENTIATGLLGANSDSHPANDFIERRLGLHHLQA